MYKKFIIFFLTIISMCLVHNLTNYLINNEITVYANESEKSEYNLYRRGDKGEGVKDIQQMLNKFEYNLKIDGVFGRLTERAVIDFQRMAGIGVDGIVGPITLMKLQLEPDEILVKEELVFKEEEKYCFANNITSLTDYIIHVNTEEQTVNIFKFMESEWKLDKQYQCSSGKPSTPTPKGIFKVKSKGNFFRVNRNSICKYYTQFYGNYLFHTVILNNNGEILDGTLGTPVSHGCVRLPIEGAKYIFDNVPRDTTVIIE